MVSRHLALQSVGARLRGRETEAERERGREGERQRGREEWKHGGTYAD
jgi:hypothetical protein